MNTEFDAREQVATTAEPAASGDFSVQFDDFSVQFDNVFFELILVTRLRGNYLGRTP